MSKIRSKNTKGELIVFRELRRRRIHFQKHYKKAVGSPDIALPRKKIAVFIDGDFWHGRKFAEQERRLPKKYWREKIRANIARDKKSRNALRKQGWKIMRVWERDLSKKREMVIERIVSFLSRH